MTMTDQRARDLFNSWAAPGLRLQDLSLEAQLRFKRQVAKLEDEVRAETAKPKEPEFTEEEKKVGQIIFSSIYPHHEWSKRLESENVRFYQGARTILAGLRPVRPLITEQQVDRLAEELYNACPGTPTRSWRTAPIMEKETWLTTARKLIEGDKLKGLV